MSQPSLHDTSVKDALVERVLEHAPFDGWGLKALERALEDLNYRHTHALRAFDGDVGEMTKHYVDLYNRKLNALAVERDIMALRVRERIEAFVLLRLKLLESHREAERQVLSFLSEPLQVPLGIKLLWSVADEIWHLAGDTATDWNYYSKRTLLSSVYGSTVFFWLQDSSPNFEETRAFLRRRITEVTEIPKFKSKLKSFFFHRAA